MEEFRSKSFNDNRMQIQPYFNGNGGAPTSMQDFRCYSASYASSVYQSQLETTTTTTTTDPPKFKKGKSTNASVSKTWSFNDPELQRKKRVASYKVYTVEGKVKGSLKKSFRWLKDRYTRVVYGWW